MKILPLFIPHQGCPFHCIYCNQNSITKTPAIDKDHFRKLIHNFCIHNPETDKEIAFFGGTFTALSQAEQLEYLQMAIMYFAGIRGIRLSTRPDYIDPQKLKFLKTYFVTTIELGIQSFSDDVLEASSRGYSAARAIAACEMVKEFGFDLVIQLLPALPGDDYNTFMKTVQQTVNLKPSGVRLYPALVLKGTLLEQYFLTGKYQPLELEDTVQWLKEAVKLFQQAQIPLLKIGLHSDLTPEDIVAGPFHPALGELIFIELLYEKLLENWVPNSTLQVSGDHISLFRGHDRLLIKKLKEHLLLDKIPVCINKDKKAPTFCFVNKEAERYW
ncbi:MAG: radical SAM protein [Candidatus Cloacimonetes bacterium]|nr:radical SAM protein [Candidatus Cloacimonadota bacterium]